MLEVRPVRQEAVEKALSAPALRAIVSHCIRAPQSVRDMHRTTNLPVASLYRHVAELVKDGVLIVERSAMTADGKAYDLYRSRLRVARLEIQDGKIVISWQLNEDLEDRIAKLWEKLGG